MHLATNDRTYLRWFTDRPLALKLGSVVGLMALVACVISVVAVNGVHELRGGEHRLAQVDRGLVEVAVERGDEQVGHERLLVQRVVARRTPRLGLIGLV